MQTRSTDSERRHQPSHPPVKAALLMIGVAFAIVLIAAASVMT